MYRCMYPEENVTSNPLTEENEDIFETLLLNHSQKDAEIFTPEVREVKERKRKK